MLMLAAGNHRDEGQIECLDNRPQIAGQVAGSDRSRPYGVVERSLHDREFRRLCRPGKQAPQRGGGISHASMWRPGRPVTCPTASVTVGQARVRKCCTRQRRCVSPAMIASEANDGSGPLAGVARARRGNSIMRVTKIFPSVPSSNSDASSRLSGTPPKLALLRTDPAGHAF